MLGLLHLSVAQARDALRGSQHQVRALLEFEVNRLTIHAEADLGVEARA